VRAHDKDRSSQLNDSYKSDLDRKQTKMFKIEKITAAAASSHSLLPASISQYFRPLVEKPHLHFAKVLVSEVVQSASDNQARPALVEFSCLPH
jgi:hypothetical protein